jgi:hypothetical protein
MQDTEEEQSKQESFPHPTNLLGLALMARRELLNFDQACQPATQAASPQPSSARQPRCDSNVPFPPIAVIRDPRTPNVPLRPRWHSSSKKSRKKISPPIRNDKWTASVTCGLVRTNQMPLEFKELCNCRRDEHHDGGCSNRATAIDGLCDGCRAAKELSANRPLSSRLSNRLTGLFGWFEARSTGGKAK